MSRETYVWRNGQVIEKRLAGPRIQADDPKVYVIGDVMEPTKHMGTGKVYDSKSKFRADTRAMGFVEVGTDPRGSQPGRTRQVSQAEVAMDVKRAIQELNSR